MNKVKKILLAILVVILVGGVLFFYRKADGVGTNTITIRYWNLFTGPDGRTMLGLVKRFNRENPDISVRMQRMKLVTYYNKLFVAGLGNRSPDVFVIHASAVERFVHSGLLRPVNTMINSENGIPLDDFSERVIDAVIRDEQIFGVPIDTHMLGMYYNEQLLKQSGFVDSQGNPSPPKTRDEFMDVLAKNTKDIDGDGHCENWGFTFTWLRTNMVSLMWQFGGRFFNDDFTQCTLNSPENVAALQFCADIVNKYKYSPAPGTEQAEGWIGFRQGRIAIAFEGIYMLPELEKIETFDISGHPVPVIGDIQATWADSHILCLGQELDGKKLDAAWRFVKFISDNSLDWAVGGQVPVRKSLLNSDRFKSMKVQSAFARQLPYIRYMPRVPYIGEFCGELDIAAEKALRGSVSAQEALDDATERVNKTIKRYNYKNKQAIDEK